MSRWFRHYAGMVRDDKLVRVALHSKQPIERVVWVYGAILESAAEINDGGRYDFNGAEAAHFLHADLADISIIEASLSACGRVCEGRVAKWGHRQFTSDDSGGRVRRYRAKQKNESNGGDGEGQEKSDRYCNGDVTLRNAPETETETETETNKREGGAPLISEEAFSLSTEILNALGEKADDPGWYAFPYTVQKWLNQSIPQEFAFSVCINLRGKHRNYLDKAVTNGWRDKQSEPVRGVVNAKSNIVDVSRQLTERIRAFNRTDGICIAEGNADVRLLPKGGG